MIRPYRASVSVSMEARPSAVRYEVGCCLGAAVRLRFYIRLHDIHGVWFCTLLHMSQL